MRCIQNINSSSHGLAVTMYIDYTPLGLTRYQSLPQVLDAFLNVFLFLGRVLLLLLEFVFVIFLRKVREENFSLESMTTIVLMHCICPCLFIHMCLFYFLIHNSFLVWFIYIIKTNIRTNLPLFRFNSFLFLPWIYSFYVLFNLDLPDLMFLCVLSPFV